MALTDLREQIAADAVEGDPEDDFEIEVIDDRPEADQRDPVDTSTVDDEDDALTDEEIEALGGRAAKRIKKLTFKYNEERRQREQVERERGEAIAAGRRLHQQATGQAADIQKYQKALLERQTTISASNIETAKGLLATAMEEGDATKIAEAQSVLTQAQIQSEGVSRTKREFEASPQGQPEGQPQGQGEPTVESIAQRKPTPQAQAWTSSNPWFGTNRRMTSFAYGVHEELVLAEVKPDTEEYYAAIDKAMRETFPAAFGGSGGTGDDAQGGDGTVVDINSAPSSSRTPVAPTGRTGGSDNRPSRGKVRLTRTQVQTAKSLGVPLKEYAKQVLAMENKA